MPISGASPNRNYSYPLETDSNPDVAAALADLASDLDTDVQALADAVVPLDVSGANITSSNPGDTKQAGSSGQAADAGHRHAREAAPRTDVVIPFHISNVLTTGLKTPKFIAPANMTLKFAYGITGAGTGAKYQVWVNGAAPAGMTDSPSTGNTAAVQHDFTDVDINAGDRVQINATNAGSSVSDLSVTIDAVWR